MRGRGESEVQRSGKKNLKTLRTELTIWRRRYKRHDGKTIYPLEKAYQIEDCGEWSPYVLGLMGYASHKQSFRKGEQDFDVYCGSKISATAIQNRSEGIGEELLVDVSLNLAEQSSDECQLAVIMIDGGMIHVGKEDYKEVKGALIQRIYRDERVEELRFAKCCSIDDFLPLFKTFCEANGVFKAKNFVVVGDCGSIVDTVHAQLFPIGTRVADTYHAMEYLVKVMKAKAKGEPIKKLPEYRRWKGLLNGGCINALLECLKKCITESVEAKEAVMEKEAREAHRYFTNHGSKMKYRKYKKEGLPTSSGPMEGMIRHVVHDRMGKCRSTWTILDANKILALRCWVLNEHYKVYLFKKWGLRW